MSGPKYWVSIPVEPIPVRATRVSGSLLRNCWSLSTSAPEEPIVRLRVQAYGHAPLCDTIPPPLSCVCSAAICARSAFICCCRLLIDCARTVAVGIESVKINPSITVKITNCFITVLVIVILISYFL